MKVLHVSPSYYPATYWGGPIFSVYGLNNALASLPNVELIVLTTDAAGPKISDRIDRQSLDEHLYPNYEVIFTRRILGASVSPGLLYRLAQLISWADIVHVTATYSFPTIPVLLLSRLFAKPLVWSLRGAILDAQKLEKVRKRKLKLIWNKLCNMIVKSSRVILHVTSQSEMETSLSQIPKAKAVLIPNGVDVPDKLYERNRVRNGKFRLLFIGRLATKKGIENLLDALSLLADETILLTICGTGDETYKRELIQRAEGLGLLGNSVHFAGHVDSEEKKNAFLEANVCVVPSHSENFAMVVAEALSYGVPVIASKGTPWQEIETHQCGLWVENAPESLADAIKLIREMDLSQMGYNGWCWMRQDYTWESVAKKMIAVYESMIDEGR